MGGEYPDLGVAAARTLGAIGPAARQVVPDLVRALDDDCSAVREAAAAALPLIDPAVLPRGARQGVGAWRARPPQGLQLACPRCQERFTAREVPFLCPDPRCPAREHPLPGQPPEWQGRPLFRPARYDHAVPCSHGPHTASVKVCPRCWSPLPAPSGCPPVVAVVGAPGSGRTCYTTALVRLLHRELARRDTFDFSLGWDDEAARRYFQEQERILFHDRSLPDAARKEAPLPSLQVTVHFPVRRRLRRLLHGPRGAASVVFPDPSADALDILEQPYCRNYLGHAQAIFLLVDPLSSAAYHRRLAAEDQGAPAPKPTVSAEELLNGLVRALRRELNQGEGRLDKQLASS